MDASLPLITGQTSGSNEVPSPPPRIERGSFQLSAVPSQGLVRIAVRGFWEADVMTRFQAALAETMRTVAGQGRRHVVLIDITASVLQSQAVIAAFTQMLAPDHPPTAARVAFVCGQGSVRMQARRMTGERANMRMFDDEPSALHWLKSRTD